MQPAVQPAAPAVPPPAAPPAVAVPPAAPPAPAADAKTPSVATAPGAPATSPAAPAAGATPPAADAGAAPDAQPAKPAAEPGQKPDDAPAAFEVKLPEGAKFDEKVLGDAKGIMADPKTTPQEKLEKLLALNHEQVKGQEKAFVEQMQKNRVADLDKLKGDPKYGGAMFDRTRADARSILEKSEHGPEVSKLLETYGLDCHPAFTKLFAEFRSLISEDSTSTRVPNPVPVVVQRPQTQTQRVANRYTNKKTG